MAKVSFVKEHSFRLPTPTANNRHRDTWALRALMEGFGTKVALSGGDFGAVERACSHRRAGAGHSPWEWPTVRLLGSQRIGRRSGVNYSCEMEADRLNHREIRMTVKKINRSHRMVYAAGLFALAVVLTTLLLAGEGNALSPKKNVFQRSLHSTYSTAMDKRHLVCAEA